MDKKIVERIKMHDENGISLLKQTYLPLIMYILKSFGLSLEDKEECVNDILLKIWNSIDNYNLEQLSLKNYIALITRRTGLNYMRKNKYNPLSCEDMDLFGTMDNYEKIEWSRIIIRLTPKETIYFYRRYYYFQSIETIALELGKTYKSVESSLYRLRKKLQELMKEEGYHE